MCQEVPGVDGEVGDREGQHPRAGPGRDPRSAVRPTARTWTGQRGGQEPGTPEREHHHAVQRRRTRSLGIRMTGEGAGGRGEPEPADRGGAAGWPLLEFFYDTDAAEPRQRVRIEPSRSGNLSPSQSISGELGMDTASGMFVLNAGLTTGMATLSGTLECGTGTFSGALSGGMYSLLGIFTGPFEGPLTSQYSGTSFSSSTASGR